MDELKIRRIVQDELNRRSNSSRFNLNTIPFHAHTGNDSSPRIKAENIIPSTSITGSITFATITQYRLNLNSSFTPQRIDIHGIIVGTDAGAVRGIVTGNALLTPTFYFQPDTVTSVIPGDIQYPFGGKPAQSSSFMTADRGSLAGIFAGSSEDHICSVFYNSTIWARATVTGFDKNAITIDVPYLQSGWSMILNFTIT